MAKLVLAPPGLGPGNGYGFLSIGIVVELAQQESSYIGAADSGEVKSGKWQVFA